MNLLKHNDNSEVKATMKRAFLSPRHVLVLASVLVVAACCGPVRADEPPRASTPDEDATRLVEDVLRKAGGNDGESLGDWTRSIIDRALERAGETARQAAPGSRGQPSVPLPAERHAAGLPQARPDAVARRKS